MWTELVKDEVWYTENFISESLVDQTLEKIQQSETKELDGDEQPHIISESYYNYNHVKYNVHKDKEVVVAVIEKLTTFRPSTTISASHADEELNR